MFKNSPKVLENITKEFNQKQENIWNEEFLYICIKNYDIKFYKEQATEQHKEERALYKSVMFQQLQNESKDFIHKLFSTFITDELKHIYHEKFMEIRNSLNPKEQEFFKQKFLSKMQEQRNTLLQNQKEIAAFINQPEEINKFTKLLKQEIQEQLKKGAFLVPQSLSRQPVQNGQSGNVSSALPHPPMPHQNQYQPSNTSSQQGNYNQQNNQQQAASSINQSSKYPPINMNGNSGNNTNVNNTSIQNQQYQSNNAAAKNFANQNQNNLSKENQQYTGSNGQINPSGIHTNSNTNNDSNNNMNGNSNNMNGSNNSLPGQSNTPKEGKANKFQQLPIPAGFNTKNIKSNIIDPNPKILQNLGIKSNNDTSRQPVYNQPNPKNQNDLQNRNERSNSTSSHGGTSMQNHQMEIENQEIPPQMNVDVQKQKDDANNQLNSNRSNNTSINAPQKNAAAPVNMFPLDQKKLISRKLKVKATPPPVSLNDYITFLNMPHIPEFQEIESRIYGLDIEDKFTDPPQIPFIPESTNKSPFQQDSNQAQGNGNQNQNTIPKNAVNNSNNQKQNQERKNFTLQNSSPAKNMMRVGSNSSNSSRNPSNSNNNSSNQQKATPPNTNQISNNTQINKGNTSLPPNKNPVGGFESQQVKQNIQQQVSNNPNQQRMSFDQNQQKINPNSIQLQNNNNNQSVQQSPKIPDQFQNNQANKQQNNNLNGRSIQNSQNQIIHQNPQYPPQRNNYQQNTPGNQQRQQQQQSPYPQNPQNNQNSMNKVNNPSLNPANQNINVNKGVNDIQKQVNPNQYNQYSQKSNINPINQDNQQYINGNNNPQLNITPQNNIPNTQRPPNNNPVQNQNQSNQSNKNYQGNSNSNLNQQGNNYNQNPPNKYQNSQTPNSKTPQQGYNQQTNSTFQQNSNQNPKPNSQQNSINYPQNQRSNNNVVSNKGYQNQPGYSSNNSANPNNFNNNSNQMQQNYQQYPQQNAARSTNPEQINNLNNSKNSTNSNQAQRSILPQNAIRGTSGDLINQNLRQNSSGSNPVNSNINPQTSQQMIYNTGGSNHYVDQNKPRNLSSGSQGQFRKENLTLNPDLGVSNYIEQGNNYQSGSQYNINSGQAKRDSNNSSYHNQNICDQSTQNSFNNQVLMHQSNGSNSNRNAQNQSFNQRSSINSNYGSTYGNNFGEYNQHSGLNNDKTGSIYDENSYQNQSMQGLDNNSYQQNDYSSNHNNNNNGFYLENDYNQQYKQNEYINEDNLGGGNYYNQNNLDNQNVINKNANTYDYQQNNTNNGYQDNNTYDYNYPNQSNYLQEQDNLENTSVKSSYYQNNQIQSDIYNGYGDNSGFQNQQNDLNTSSYNQQNSVIGMAAPTSNQSSITQNQGGLSDYKNMNYQNNYNSENFAPPVSQFDYQNPVSAVSNIEEQKSVQDYNSYQEQPQDQSQGNNQWQFDTYEINPQQQNDVPPISVPNNNIEQQKAADFNQVSSHNMHGSNSSFSNHVYQQDSNQPANQIKKNSTQNFNNQNMGNSGNYSLNNSIRSNSYGENQTSQTFIQNNQQIPQYNQQPYPNPTNQYEYGFNQQVNMPQAQIDGVNQPNYNQRSGSYDNRQVLNYSQGQQQKQNVGMAYNQPIQQLNQVQTNQQHQNYIENRKTSAQQNIQSSSQINSSHNMNEQVYSNNNLQMNRSNGMQNNNNNSQINYQNVNANQNIPMQANQNNYSNYTPESTTSLQSPYPQNPNRPVNEQMKFYGYTNDQRSYNSSTPSTTYEGQNDINQAARFNQNLNYQNQQPIQQPKPQAIIPQAQFNPHPLNTSAGPAVDKVQVYKTTQDFEGDSPDFKIINSAFEKGNYSNPYQEQIKKDIKQFKQVKQNIILEIQHNIQDPKSFYILINDEKRKNYGCLKILVTPQQYKMIEFLHIEKAGQILKSVNSNTKLIDLIKHWWKFEYDMQNKK
ncbi:hypothetical protein TTHERM_00989470 (macronuclear) [Tetrahymena thermophila SB210]|uniref:Uncharacterized protein n=1 Tax=Tetrahymena thermophila (strain SB210) TaxID=312017 RepID=Q240K2_TETTS|nr:hypothetical protein TTHERM_00989470 [Tetrahymena thermophila SB210]EAS02206.1 hypothetical protein TTHERM_00989470 [Tetrahymena thermophila SB210]|eukprot:XP_001022451.1 hypothetical protein TTHERM_00989470 [Tetrahymena thermophila SB210]